MGHADEPKMDDLKRLLRRLDGLGASNAIAAPAQDALSEPRGYVGALRGAPSSSEEADASPPSATANGKASSHAPVFVAALMAAIVSTVTVYLVMSWQGNPGTQSGGATPPASEQRVVPSTLDYQPSPSAPGDTGPRQPNDAADGLLRRAEQLLEGGEVETARVLLEQAAGLGSGAAALKLGRSYDPTQAEAQRPAGGETNPALAKAWYERALALGTREAAGYISDAGGR